jgi:hypothetical protein
MSMKISSTFDGLPREDRYMFNELFKDPQQATWYATDLHEPDTLQKLANSMPDRGYELVQGPDDSCFYYLIIR